MFKLSERSLNELKGVHPDLVSVVKLAIQVTEQDFSVHDGIRTKEQQKVLYDNGASHTMFSRHITGHAVDLVPFLNGKLRWEWPPIYKIAEAVRRAGIQLGIPIRWGGAWDITLTNTRDNPEKLVKEYSDRQRIAGSKVFLDGPHFELPKTKYI